MEERMGMNTAAAYRHGQAAIVEALRAFGAQGERHTPWMKARDLARSVGAADETDPQFQANVQALYEAGSIRLMSGSKASGGSFFEAMLVPAAEPAELAGAAE
jgi:hypothetical protein